MKTKIFSFLAFAGLLATSCSDNPDYPVDSAKDFGQVSLSDLGVDVDDAEIVISRADVETSDYIVKIVNADGEEAYSAPFADCRDAVITLPVADGYTVQVHSHNVENAAWNAPYYYGEKSFDVKKNEITSVGTVNCSFSNIRVSVRYSDELLAMLDGDAAVTVKCSETGSSLTFGQSESRSGYFRALEGSTTLGAEFSGMINGQLYTLTKGLSDVKAGQHRIVTFSVRSGGDIPIEAGNVQLGGDGEGVKLADGLWLVAAVVTEDIHGNVTVGEEGDSSAQRPGKEEDQEPVTPVDPEKPVDPVAGITIQAVAPLDLDKQNPTNLSQYIVRIHADRGIYNLEITISTDSDEFRPALEEMLPTQFDMAHPGTLESTLRDDLGFAVGDEVLGHTDVDFVVDPFLISLLAGYPGVHTFTISVTDKEGGVPVVKELIIKA